MLPVRCILMACVGDKPYLHDLEYVARGIANLETGCSVHRFEGNHFLHDFQDRSPGNPMQFAMATARKKAAPVFSG